MTRPGQGKGRVVTVRQSVPADRPEIVPHFRRPEALAPPASVMLPAEFHATAAGRRETTSGDAAMSAPAIQSPRSARRSPAARAAVRHGRRRLIDPTTCERDYAADEMEFMQAIDDYTRTSGRLFPTCSEILEVVKALGYRRNDA